MKYFGGTSTAPGPSTSSADMTAAEGTSSETSGASTPSSDVTAATEVITEVPQPSTSTSDMTASAVFETLGKVKSRLWVLLNFPTLDDEALEKQCEELENTLRSGEEADIYGRELAMEIRNLPVTNRITAFELTELYPNLSVHFI